MVRASLERVLGADRLDLWYERTAQKQYTRDLLFSSVYDMSITDCAARMRNSRALNCFASRTISRKTS